MTDFSVDSIYNRINMNCMLQVKRYYAVNYDFFEMEPHAHEEFEVMYAASGSCTVFYWTKDRNKEKLFLKEGEYVIIDCNILHQLEVARGTKCRVLNLEIAIRSQKNGALLPYAFEKSKSFQNFMKLWIPVFKGYDDTGSLHTIIRSLHKQMQIPMEEPENQLLQNLMLIQFLIEAGRQSAKRHPAESGDKYVRKALLYLADHFEEDIRIIHIAKEIGISAAYLQRIFKEQTGKTLVDKMNELRIQKAKILLETSRLPIIDIAVSVGYNNRQHFTYTFLKMTGSSPSVYRKHRGNYLVFEGFGKDI